MTLRWVKPDQHHIRTECGRYAVCRLTIAPDMWYVAWRTPYHELGATKLPGTATDAERQAAIRDMQQICEAAAIEAAA